jgi:hypothetical protein
MTAGSLFIVIETDNVATLSQRAAEYIKLQYQ